jgi:5'-nucleotidase
MAKGDSAPLLENTRVLVTNDDGINAPGLKVLTKLARALSSDVWVVAPESEQSAMSHAMTLRRPLYIRKYGPKRFSVDGTPTDCVLVGVNHVLKDRRPGLVLSGINNGGNLAEDMSYSGTVSAAKEATFLGIRAVALSQLGDWPNAIAYDPAEEHGADLLGRLWQAPWPRDVLFNVNFPGKDTPGQRTIRCCPQGRRAAGTSMTEGKDPNGRRYVWIGSFPSDESRDKGSDLQVVLDGDIALTPLHLDMTHQPSLKRLREHFQ